ncbi:lysophospholipid acyltransferase 7-like isoform X1 [Epargyreus clarus]|uniref:lysophospholipid acyltransferase 7-like isoform X1 n=1 Tax=Epargyreus clarus TaxID=520877 RepID=UPI003C2C69F4
MNSDDVIFYSSLLLCVSLANYYKKIDDKRLKRNYGTGLGILVACLICGHSILHTVIMVWGNIVIIKCCDKRYVHQMSLAYTWLYLSYLHWSLQKNCYIIWLHQTLALRLVGLAFEISTYQRLKVDPGMSTIKPNMDNECLSTDPSAGDIISYAFYFTGIHKGPYYRWKVFDDHFNAPFGTLGDCRIITEQKLKKAFACSLGYLLLRLKYSPQMYYERAFYIKYGSDFRFLYNIPQLTMYFLHYQIVMLLCTSVCTEAGFGVYPAKCLPIPGYGPSTRFSLLKLASACSFVAWSIWVGPSIPQIIVSSTLWVYVHLESEYCELYDTTGSMKIPWNIGFSIMRVFCLIYLAPCLIVHDTATVLRYYNSIYWIYHFFLLFLIVAAIVIFKLKDSL